MQRRPRLGGAGDIVAGPAEWCGSLLPAAVRRPGAERVGEGLRRGSYPVWPVGRIRHRRRDLAGIGEGEVFGGVVGRQYLDHRLVLDPHLDHMERTAIAAEALPAFPARDLFDRLAIG